MNANDLFKYSNMCVRVVISNSLSFASREFANASGNPQPCCRAASHLAKFWGFLSSCVTLLCRDLNPVANFACRKSICKDIALEVACAPNTMRGVLKIPIFQSLYAS